MAAIEAAELTIKKRVRNRIYQRQWKAKLKTNPDSIKQQVDSPDGIQERYQAYTLKSKLRPEYKIHQAEHARQKYWQRKALAEKGSQR